MPSAKSIKNQKDLLNADFDYFYKPSQIGMLKTRIKQLELAPFLAIDCETMSTDYKNRKSDALDPHRGRVRLVQIGIEDYALLVDLNLFRPTEERGVNWDQDGAMQLKRLLEGDQMKSGQSFQFDINFLRGEGVHLGGPLFDTLSAGIINNGTGHKNDLKSLCKRYLLVEIDKTLGKEDWSQEELPEDYLKYAAIDAIVTARITPLIHHRLKQEGLEHIFKFEMAVLRAICEMNFNGMPFDRKAALEVRESLLSSRDGKLMEFVAALDEKLIARKKEPLPRDPDGSFNLRAKDSGSVRLGTKQLKGFNPDSSQQMIKALLDAGVRLEVNRKTRKHTVDQNLLKKVSIDEKERGKSTEVIDGYLEWKNAATLCKHINTLIGAASDADRICSTYKQYGTETGRLSAAGPNLQQVPKDFVFRNLMRAREGWKFLKADFSQVELRVVAELAQEPVMMQAYKDGRDLHTETAALMSGVPLDQVSKSARQSAKIANFGLLYGAGPGTLAQQALTQYDLVWTDAEAREKVNAWHAAFPDLRKWQIETGERTTGAIYTKMGRRRLCMTERSSKFTTRINTEVQGTAGDIAKLGLIKIFEQLRRNPDEALLIGTVHDEILMEVKTEHAEKWRMLLKDAMESAGIEIMRDVPIVAETQLGDTWAEKEG